MKLVDILARELKVWPEGVAAITQTTCSPVLRDSSYQAITPVIQVSRIADDAGGHSSVGVTITRTEWQAAVEALKDEQASELKWPDGAEFKGEGSDNFYRNVTSDSFEVWIRSRSFWETVPGVPSYQPLIPRPTERAVEWDGVGSPPVGIRIEARHKEAKPDWARPSWYETEIVAIGKQLLIFEADGSGHEKVGELKYYEFRPIRTQDQIAAEERMAAAYAMCDIAPSLSNVDAVALYDAGYRKQVAE